MAKPSTYHYDDIRRYLARQMNPREMHDFEHAMHEDPFLADALEGFRKAETSVTDRHLSAIEAAIANTGEQAKVVPFATKKTKWWQVAALVLLLAGAGIVVFQLNDVQEQVATVQQVPGAKQIPATADSIVPAPSSPALTRNPPAAQNELLAATTTSPIDAPSRQASTRSAKDNEAANDQIAMAAPVETGTAKAEETNESDSRTSSRKVASTVREFEGKVTDELGEPVPMATVKVQEKNLATITDADGKFKLRAQDSVVEVSVQSAGYAKTNKKLVASETPVNITVEEEKQSLSEVVVTGMTRAKKSASRRYQRQAAEPIGGWQKFHQHVQQKIDSIRSTNAMAREEVALEFSIDRSGTPFNIDVNKSASPAARQYAIHILLSGPKWKEKKAGEKVSTTISF